MEVAKMLKTLVKWGIIGGIVMVILALVINMYVKLSTASQIVLKNDYQYDHSLQWSQ